MIKLTQERVKDVLAYMEDDLPNCLYLYGDIIRYGVDDPNMTVWYSEKDGDINAVVMKYFSGSHVYSKKLDYELAEIVEKLQEIDPDRISSQREIIERLSPILKSEYGVEYGVVFRGSCYRKFKSYALVERAGPEDADAIADLLLTHETFSKTYEKSTLAQELADRMTNGIGRSYVIRDGGRVIAHDGVSLETDKYMVLSLALVHDDYRKTMYGAILESYMLNELGKEGKEIYFMISQKQRSDGHERMGNQVVADYGKLFKRTLEKD